MTDKKLRKFIQERDEALLSLDEKKIRKYAKKWRVALPENENVFWAGVHKAIVSINSASEQQKGNSRKWLVEHGFKPYIT